MEATIQSTNKTINIDVSVSINVDALQAIKQRVLSAVADKFSVIRSQFSVWRVYRQELRLARAVARAIDRHNVISNLWIGGCTAALFLYIVMFA